jgi:hypothetical protein
MRAGITSPKWSGKRAAPLNQTGCVLHLVPHAAATLRAPLASLTSMSMSKATLSALESLRPLHVQHRDGHDFHQCRELYGYDELIVRTDGPGTICR